MGQGACLTSLMIWDPWEPQEGDRGEPTHSTKLSSGLHSCAMVCFHPPVIISKVLVFLNENTEGLRMELANSQSRWRSDWDSNPILSPHSMLIYFCDLRRETATDRRPGNEGWQTFWWPQVCSPPSKEDVHQLFSPAPAAARSENVKKNLIH